MAATPSPLRIALSGGLVPVGVLKASSAHRAGLGLMCPVSVALPAVLRRFAWIKR